MPLPIILGYIASGIGYALLGGTVLYVATAAWNAIESWWNKKRIAIIGARGVGKTHLCTFLLHGEIPQEYEQTAEPIEFSGRTFKLEKLKLSIDDIIDLPGAKHYYPQWEKVCEDADVIFYLTKANEIFGENKATLSRIESDFTRINEWLKLRNPKPLFFVVSTFCDMHDEFEDITPSTYGDYKDKFEQKEIVKRLKTLSENNGYRSAVILGSMKDIRQTERLVKRLLDQVLLEK